MQFAQRQPQYFALQSGGLKTCGPRNDRTGLDFTQHVSEREGIIGLDGRDLIEAVERGARTGFKRHVR